MRERVEQGFARWGHLAYRYAWLVIVLSAAFTVGLATQLPRLRIDTSTEGFLRESDPVRKAYKAFRQQFGRDDLIVLAIEAPDIFNPKFLDRLRRLHEEIEDTVPMVEEVTSLINARDTYGDGDELIVGQLLEDWPLSPGALAAVKKRALANPLYSNMLLSPDGRVTTVLIKTDAFSSAEGEGDVLSGFDESDTLAQGASEKRPFITSEENHAVVRAVRKLVDRYRRPDFAIYLSGPPVTMDYLTEAMQRDMARFTLLALAAIAFFLAFLFRRFAAVLLPLIGVIASVVCTISLMAIAGTPLSLPTQILPSFLLAVGVGNSVHILVIFYQRRRSGDSKEEALAFAMGHSGLAILMTSLTTAGGLVSFAAAEMAPISDFGIFGPIGVLMALAMTILLLPALISVFPMRDEQGVRAGHAWAQKGLVRVGDFATRRAVGVVAATGVLLAISLAGVAQLRFSHDPIRWFPEGSFVRRSVEFFNDRMGGALFLELLIDTGRENGMQSPDMLRRVDRFADFAQKLKINRLSATKVVSLVDIQKEIHRALNENRPDFYRIPEDPKVVAQELLLFENSGSDDLEDVTDTRFQMGRVTLKFAFVDAVHYPAFLAALEGGLDQIFGDRVHYTVTGLMAVVGRTINAIIHSMAASYVIAFLIITPLMVLLIGDLKVGLTSMIPNLTPIIVTLGLMGWADLPLDAFTLLVGSIAIGLAVDDTIHFMHNFRRYIDQSGDVATAVRMTLASTGQAMLYTSLVLSTGFFLYMWSSLGNLFYFGLLTGFTIIVAFLADVILSPALLMLVVREGSLVRQHPESLSARSKTVMEEVS